jgi:hypothetical protein
MTVPRHPLWGDSYKCPAPVGAIGTVVDHSDVHGTTVIAFDDYIGGWAALDEHFELASDHRRTYSVKDLRQIAEDRETWARENTYKGLHGEAREQGLTGQLARWLVALLEDR